MKRLFLGAFIFTVIFVSPAQARTPTVNGLFSYGGIVLKVLDVCTNGKVIAIGPPSPAIILVSPPTTQLKLWYMATVPGEKDLGNAYEKGRCKKFNIFGKDIGYDVPVAFYLGSTKITSGGKESEAPKALPVDETAVTNPESANATTNDPLNSGSPTTGISNTDAKSAGLSAFNQYKGQVKNQQYMGVMDYTKPSSAERFSIIDTTTGETVYSLKASHGVGSDPTGTEFATRFSDVSGSHMSELGAFKATSYYSPSMQTNVLLLNGLQTSNVNTASRFIEIHPSDYVTGASCGMSYGCIGYPSNYQNIVNNLLKDGFIYNYYK